MGGHKTILILHSNEIEHIAQQTFLSDTLGDLQYRDAVQGARRAAKQNRSIYYSAGGPCAASADQLGEMQLLTTEVKLLDEQSFINSNKNMSVVKRSACLRLQLCKSSAGNVFNCSRWIRRHPLHSSSSLRTDGVYPELTAMRVRIPWIEAFRNHQESSESPSAVNAASSNTSPRRDVSPKKMSASYHRIVSGRLFSSPHVYSMQ